MPEKPNKHRKDELVELDSQPKKKGGEAFFVELKDQDTAIKLPKAPVRQLYEKGIAFAVDFNSKEDPEQVDSQQTKMKKLTQSYYEQYFRKINKDQPEDKDESP